MLPWVVIQIKMKKGMGGGSYLDMMSNSWSFHEGLGSAFKNAPTEAKSANSTKTEP
jgi:hypothetical protein